MIIIIGLVLLIAAVIIGVAAVVGNTGATQQLTSDFTVFDYHFHGSTGALFGYGIALGAIGMLGLALVLTGARRATRRGAAARREIAQSRREVAAVRREAAVGVPEKGAATGPRGTHEPAWRRWFGKRATTAVGAAPPDRGAGRPSTSK